MLDEKPDDDAQTVTAAANTSLPMMHPSIVKAICKVQSSIEAVPKSQINRHGGYNFASTDDIYAAVTRKLGEAGLVIYPLELAPVEIRRAEIESTDREGNATKKTVQWGKFHFGYALVTEQATWFDPRSAQSLLLQITGPQSHNAAESYAQKTYLRALFKLPTGDMDLDSMPQADTEEEQIDLSAGKGKRKTSAEAKRDGSVKVFDGIKLEITQAGGAIECQDIWKKHYKALQTLPRSWFDTLAQDYTAMMNGWGVEVEIPQQGSLRMS